MDGEAYTSATRDCTLLADWGVVGATAHDIELASATVRTELLTPERDWYRAQMSQDLKKWNRLHPRPKVPRPAEMCDSDKQVLAILQKHGALPLPQIVGMVTWDRTTVHGALMRLIDHGMVEYIGLVQLKPGRQSPVYRVVEPLSPNGET